jgi:hypothetical protein
MRYLIKVVGLVLAVILVSLVSLSRSYASGNSVASTSVGGGLKTTATNNGSGKVAGASSKPASELGKDKQVKALGNPDKVSPQAKNPGTLVDQKPLKLRNVKLVVEDVDDKTYEKLVPVEPVVLRQKPKTVQIVEGKRDSLVLPSSGARQGNLGNNPESSVPQENKPILIVSQIQEEEAPVLGVNTREGYSPFHPPAPGAFPSTLSERELVNVGAGSGSELLPLPPVSNVGGLSNLDPRLPAVAGGLSSSQVRVERALAVGFGHNPQGISPSLLQNPNSNGFGIGQSTAPVPSYYTDSESSALLHMATDAKGFEGPSSSVIGQLW